MEDNINQKRKNLITLSREANKLGEKFFTKGILDKAYQLFSKALELNPQNAIAKINIGAVYGNLGDLQKAEQFCEAAFKLNRKNSHIVLTYGKVLVLLGKVRSAHDVYQSFLEHTHNKAIGQAMADLEANVLPFVSGSKRSPQQKPNQVVFVSDWPRSREAKLAFGLKQAGWNVILLHKRKPTFIAGKYFIETVQYQDSLELLRSSFSFNPVVYHVFSNWSFETAAILIRNNPGKIVFDDYDVMAGMTDESMVNSQYPGQFGLEKYCLENADGICCRSLETQYARHVLNYSIKGRRLFFPEYMWGRAATGQDFSPTSDNGNDAIVYCGNIPDYRKTPERYSYLIDIAEQLSLSGLQLHIYPSSDTFQPSPDLPANLILHPHQKPEDLIGKMEPCLAGLQVPHFADYHKGLFQSIKKQHSMAAKIFDFLDAGLPIVIGNQRFQRWLIKRYNSAIELSRSQPVDVFSRLEKKVLLMQRNILRKNFDRIEQHLGVCKQTQRLINYYHTL